MKKGGLTSTQLITIILIVAGLVIIFGFISRIGWAENVDRGVCHESVVIRGTLPDYLFADTKSLSPLKCKTRKICFSDNLIKKGECSEDYLGEKFDTIRVSSDLEKQKTQIKMMIAREMADCWNMMGEGKLLLFNRGTFTSDTECVICSIADFESDVKTKNEKVDGMTYYLMSHLVPNTNKTYWEYLTRSNANNLFIEKGKKLSDIDKLYSQNPKAIVYIEIQKTRIGAWFGIGVGTIIGALIGKSVGAPIGAVIGSIVIPIPVVGTAVGGGIGFVVSGIAGGVIGGVAGNSLQTTISSFEGDSAAGIVLADYDPQEFQKIGCDSFENIP